MIMQALSALMLLMLMLLLLRLLSYSLQKLATRVIITLAAA